MAKVVAIAIALVLVCVSMVGFSHGETTQEVSSCSPVVNNLFPCLSFVLSGGNSVDPGCCSGLKTLLRLAGTRTDRQTVCTCLKSLASSASDDEIKNAAKIPKLCGVKLPFRISRNIDCSKIN